MHWVTVFCALGIPTTAVAFVRGGMFFYALRGTDPKERPAIIRALGRMHQDARSELLPLRRQQSQDRPQLPG